MIVDEELYLLFPIAWLLEKAIALSLVVWIRDMLHGTCSLRIRRPPNMFDMTTIPKCGTRTVIHSSFVEQYD